MGILIVIIGILLTVLGVYVFKKLPGISIKHVRALILTGILIVIAGVLIIRFIPKKGLLSAGESIDSGNDDVSGKTAENGDTDISRGTVVIDGSSIIISNGTVLSPAAFDEYIKTDEWQGDYELIDRYALYDTYTEAKEILERNGKTVGEERAEE